MRPARGDHGSTTRSTDLATIHEHRNDEPVASSAAAEADHDTTSRSSGSGSSCTSNSYILHHPNLDPLATFEWRSVDEAAVATFWGEVTYPHHSLVYGRALASLSPPLPNPNATNSPLQEHNLRFIEDYPLEFALWQYNPRTFILINVIFSMCNLVWVISTMAQSKYGEINVTPLPTPIPTYPPSHEDSTAICAQLSQRPVHPGVESRANLKSISHRCHLFEVAFVWEMTEETIDLPLGCLQGGLAAGNPDLHRPPRRAESERTADVDYSPRPLVA